MRTFRIALVPVIVVLLAGAGSSSFPAESPTPRAIIEKSIAYHDPKGNWSRGGIHLDVRTTYSSEFAERVGSKEAEVTLWLSPARETFRYHKSVGSDIVEYTLAKREGTVSVNGSTDITGEDRERLRLAEPSLYRDYFEYLYGMPMKLLDPGTHLDSTATRVSFNGRESWAVRVTYDADVGDDTWYFYFDPDTFALRGYRFFHDEAKNDGEYISFEGEIHDKETGMRLPKTRAWYYNADDRHLATDDIIALTAE